MSTEGFSPCFLPGTKSGGFSGSVSGSVRSLAVHPTEPLLASVGLDRFLRIHDTQTRQLQAKVFLKQQMVACAFDTDPARQVRTEGSVLWVLRPFCYAVRKIARRTRVSGVHMGGGSRHSGWRCSRSELT